MYTHILYVTHNHAHTQTDTPHTTTNMCMYYIHATNVYTHIHHTLCMQPHTYVHTRTLYTHSQTCTQTHSFLKMKQTFGCFAPGYLEVLVRCPQTWPADPSLTSPCQSRSLCKNVGRQPQRSCCSRCQRESAAFIFKGKRETLSGYLNKAMLLNDSFKN